ncbi:hypothetical protein P3W85_33080 [Cupriavidus basilensis]|uniref:Uncharacterized protein n=1 Tax=Cupriavidus basilensis TaxID=68895 RepID=A0ABT6AZP6_9BURK|nr:hypothetical protein [Cupriavidus basilensis]MDF3837732.1 hypothetical protein [Cupriavidus basilensis]
MNELAAYLLRLAEKAFEAAIELSDTWIACLMTAAPLIAKFDG